MIMPDPAGRYRGSRDRFMLQCDAVMCPVNRDNHCSMPSVVKIDAGGRCRTYVEMMKDATPPPASKRTKCKIARCPKCDRVKYQQGDCDHPFHS